MSFLCDESCTSICSRLWCWWRWLWVKFTISRGFSRWTVFPYHSVLYHPRNFFIHIWDLIVQCTNLHCLLMYSTVCSVHKTLWHFFSVADPVCFWQCSGSMTFWCGSGSGSADPCLWLMDPDPDADPSIFIIDLRITNLKEVFLHSTFWRYFYIIFQR